MISALIEDDDSRHGEVREWQIGTPIRHDQPDTTTE